MLLINFLKPLGWAVLRILFSVEYQGVENIPESGPVIIAGNHPSYLDPVLIGLPVKRKIRFMAWDALFRVPVLGRIISALGAFPVDIRKGHGESAYRQALTILESGQALGIFPEGQRSEGGPMGELRTGVARLAIETGAPIIPATIGGAARAWPKYRLLPKPARIVVRFHHPLRLDEEERRERAHDRNYHSGIMETVASRINRSLGPSLRGDESIEKWYQEPPSNIRTYEWAPLIALVVALIVAFRRGTLAGHWPGIVLPPLAYYLYLLADLTVIRQARLSKWLRNSMPVWLILIWHLLLTAGLALGTGERNLMLVVTGLTVFFSFFYEDYFKLQKFVRGIVVGYYFSLLLMVGWPHPLGVFTGILSFIIIFAFWHRITLRGWIAVVCAAVMASGLWLTESTTPRLMLYAGLAAAVNAYLTAFVSIAYDIRKAGSLKDDFDN